MGRRELVLHDDLETEINQAFANCELNLKNVGGKAPRSSSKPLEYFGPLN